MSQVFQKQNLVQGSDGECVLKEFLPGKSHGNGISKIGGTGSQGKMSMHAQSKLLLDTVGALWC